MRYYFILLSFFVFTWLNPVKGDAFQIEVKQITHGPMTHFFGYIGHVQNIPWNRSGRYIVALQTNFHDRMPGKMILLTLY